jgi:hypothetical protein
MFPRIKKAVKMNSLSGKQHDGSAVSFLRPVAFRTHLTMGVAFSLQIFHVGRIDWPIAFIFLLSSSFFQLQEERPYFP